MKAEKEKKKKAIAFHPYVNKHTMSMGFVFSSLLSRTEGPPSSPLVKWMRERERGSCDRQQRTREATNHQLRSSARETEKEVLILTRVC